MARKSRTRNDNGRFKKGSSGNPGGRKPGPKQEVRGDGWGSALAGLGRAGSDKRLSFTFEATILDDTTAMELWRGDDLAATIIEKIPNEMTREGCSMLISDESVAEPVELQQDVETFWDDIGALSAIQRALEFERAYGGSVILLGAQDNAVDMTEPLNVTAIRSFDWMTVLEASEVQPKTYYVNPREPKFGQPQTYTITAQARGTGAKGETAPPTFEVHETRLIPFLGIQVSRRQQSINQGWGDSVLNRVHGVLRDFNIGWSAAGVLLADFSFAVYKMAGLATAIATDGDKTLSNRLKAIELARSVANLTIVDAEEEYGRETTDVAGLSPLLEQFKGRVAAAARMPITLLFGQSPGGMNATGESDIRLFYDQVAAWQRRKLVPALEYITSLFLAMKLRGGGPTDWKVTCNPLWQPTDKELAETNEIQSNADVNYINTGVLSADEVAKSRFGGTSFSLTTQIDTDARDLMAVSETPQNNEGDPDVDNNTDSSGQD